MHPQIESNDTEWLSYLDKIFAAIDKDGNGFISLDELIDYIPPNTCSSAGMSMEEVEAQARLMLREADTNRDGQISKEEFYDLMNSVIPDSLDQYEPRVTDLV